MRNYGERAENAACLGLTTMEGYRTVRTSVILVAVDSRLEAYSSLEDLPAELREKLVESTSGDDAATILIADRKGRDAMLRSLRKRVLARRRRGVPVPASPRQVPGGWLRTWGAILLSGAAGLTVWLVATWR